MISSNRSINHQPAREFAQRRGEVELRIEECGLRIANHGPQIHRSVAIVR